MAAPDDFGDSIVELELLDADGTTVLPFVLDRHGSKHFVAAPGRRFHIRYAVSSGVEVGAKVSVDGTQLESVQPFRKLGHEALKLPGFPFWRDGVCMYRDFTFAPSIAYAGDAHSALQSRPSGMGSVRVDCYEMSFHAALPSGYSSQADAQQVRVAAAMHENKKFFETPAVSAAPGTVSAGVGQRAALAIGAQGRHCASRTIHFDTAANLELRGLLDRDRHAHLLPPEPEPARATSAARRAPPPSDMVTETIIDLLGDDEVITVRKKRREVRDISDDE